MDLTAETQPWPQRAWILGLIGALGGVAIHFLTDRSDLAGAEVGALRYATASFVGAGALIFGHGWTRGHILRAALFAGIGAAIIALVFLWNGTPDKGWSAGEGWRIAAAILAVFVLVPLFQTAGEHDARLPRSWSPAALRGWTRESLPYALVHDHAWTNLLVAGLSALFAAAFLLMLMLVAQLFLLIDIHQFEKVMREEVTILAVLGGAIGASTGLLRERRKIIASLQGVAMMVLRVAAPVLAVALLLFLAALIFTGLAPLWEATRSTTPILLAVGIVALLLANSVVGHGSDEESRSVVYRWAAMALGLALVPLATIAAVSTGLRVGQYGWTPDRLWATVFVAMACVTAATYLVSILRGRARWAEAIRGANLRLAMTIGLFALLLSTPLIRFDAIATSDQVARLNDGRVPADKFDYRALWFDFGASGKEAIRKLATGGASPAIRSFAQQVQRLQSVWEDDPAEIARRQGSDLDSRLTILPAKIALPARLRARLTDYEACGRDGRCTVYYRPGENWALAVGDAVTNCPNCKSRVSLITDILGDPVENSANELERAAKRAGGGIMEDDGAASAIRAGKVEMREERMQRVYIDGKPFGDPLPLGSQAP